MATTGINAGKMFDAEYGELVRRITFALVNDHPTYEIPEELLVHCSAKEKKLHTPKFSSVDDTIQVDTKPI